MKRKRIASIAAVSAAAIAMALNPQAGTVKQSNEVTTSQEQKQTATKETVAKKVTRHNVNGSGLDLVRTGGDYGMSPKEYGIRFGRGNRAGKKNMLMVSHSYKVKKRKA